MNLSKNIFLIAALALNGAAPLFAGPVAYREAAAPWSAEQAAKITPAITADFLKEVTKDFGSSQAAALAEKKEKVSALLGRFTDCSLNAGDLKTAEKYFTPEFKEEVRFAGAAAPDSRLLRRGGRPRRAPSPLTGSRTFPLPASLPLPRVLPGSSTAQRTPARRRYRLKAAGPATKRAGRPPSAPLPPNPLPPMFPPCAPKAPYRPARSWRGRRISVKTGGSTRPWTTGTLCAGRTGRPIRKATWPARKKRRL